eukprot:115374-Rhodomonas_salina.3
MAEPVQRCCLNTASACEGRSVGRFNALCCSLTIVLASSTTTNSNSKVRALRKMFSYPLKAVSKRKSKSKSPIPFIEDWVRETSLVMTTKGKAQAKGKEKGEVKSMQGLTAEQVQELRELFSIFDEDDSGSVSADELGQATSTLAWAIYAMLCPVLTHA